jgi:hypothetical protein
VRGVAIRGSVGVVTPGIYAMPAGHRIHGMR